MNEPNKIKRIYRKAAKLNLYFYMCEPKLDRVYRELKDIEKDVKEVLNILERYFNE